MPRKPQMHAQNSTDTSDIGDLQRAEIIRREANWRLSMSERLALVHQISKQMSAIAGAARAR